MPRRADRATAGRPSPARVVRVLLAGLLVTGGVWCLGSALATGQELPPLAEITLVLETDTIDFGLVSPGLHEAATPVRATVSSELAWRLLAAAVLPPGVGLDWSVDGAPWNPFGEAEVVVLDDQPPAPAPAPFTCSLRLHLDWSVPPGQYSFPVACRAEFTDRTPPEGGLAIDGGAEYTRSRLVALTPAAGDPSGVGSMRFSDDGATFGPWLNYAGTHGYELPAGDGPKEVWVQFRDRAGNVSSPYRAGITLDTIPPAISGVAVEDFGPTWAVVTWQTDEPASGQVEYGPTPAYGYVSPVPPGPNAEFHRVTLTGLVSGTTYHYCARSADRAGNESVAAGWQLNTGLLPPRNLVAAVTGSHVDLAWEATLSPGPSGYRVWRRNVLENGAFGLLAEIPGTDLFYRDRHVLQSLKSYHLEYRVTAVKAGHQESEPSNPAAVRKD